MGLLTVEDVPDHAAHGHGRRVGPDPDRGFTAPGTRPVALTPAALLRLQRLAGNRAVAATQAIRPLPIQRCGPIPCDCGPEERVEKEAALQGDRDPAIATSGGPGR